MATLITSFTFFPFFSTRVEDNGSLLNSFDNLIAINAALKLTPLQNIYSPVNEQEFMFDANF